MTFTEGGMHLELLVILAISVEISTQISKQTPPTAYIHMTGTNSKAFGYFGHCTLITIK